jgi:hypothetical protein
MPYTIAVYVIRNAGDSGDPYCEIVCANPIYGLQVIIFKFVPASIIRCDYDAVDVCDVQRLNDEITDVI